MKWLFELCPKYGFLVKAKGNYWFLSLSKLFEALQLLLTLEHVIRIFSRTYFAEKIYSVYYNVG